MSIPLPHAIHHYLGGISSGGGGDDDDGPFRNRPHKSTHELDPTPAISTDPDGGRDQEPKPTFSSSFPLQMGQKRRRRVPDGPLNCAVCLRSFKSMKALHGHMRCHPERNWRGVAPQVKESGSEKEAAASLMMLSEGEVKAKGEAEGEGEGRGGELFKCELCKTGFKTRQALGGHRASHKSKKGCYMKGKEGVKGKNVVTSSTTAKRRRFEVDLNLPPPSDEEEEEKEKKNRSQS